MARWAGAQPEGSAEDDAVVFKRDVRKSMEHSLKLSDVSVWADFKRISNRSLRSGGESLMFAVCFEMEIVKRRGRRVSATFRQYLWRGEYILSNICRGMLRQNKNHGRPEPCYPPPRDGGKRAKMSRSAHRRSVAISKCMSGALRHRKLPGVTDEGWAPLQVLLILRGILTL